MEPPDKVENNELSAVVIESKDNQSVSLGRIIILEIDCVDVDME